MIINGKDAKQLVAQCEKWWDTVGRHLVRPEINRIQLAADVRAAKGAPVMILRKAPEPDLNDGILLARPWAELTKRERKKVWGAYLMHKVMPDRVESESVN